MRELAAQLYAVVVSTMTGNELQMAVHNLVKITKDNHVSYFVSIERIIVGLLATIFIIDSLCCMINTVVVMLQNGLLHLQTEMRGTAIVGEACSNVWEHFTHRTRG